MLVKLETNWKRRMSVLKTPSSRTKNLKKKKKKVNEGIPLNVSFSAQVGLANCMTKSKKYLDGFVGKRFGKWG